MLYIAIFLVCFLVSLKFNQYYYEIKKDGFLEAGKVISTPEESNILSMKYELFFICDPSLRLFLKQDGSNKYWSVSEHKQKAYAILTSIMHEAYFATSQKEAEEYLKNRIVSICGYGVVGGGNTTVELDTYLDDKVDNSQSCAILNVKLLMIRKIEVAYSILASDKVKE